MKESVKSSAIIDAMIADNEKTNLPKLDSSVLSLKGSRISPSYDSQSQGILQEENLVENTVLKVDSNIDQQILDISYGLPIIQRKEAINNCLACGQIGCQCAQRNINNRKDTNTSNRSSQIQEHLLNGDRHDHDHEEGLEADFPIYNAANADLAASSSSSASLASNQTFLLHSNASAKHTIYLDFTGHTTSGTWWNDGGTIQSSVYDRDGNKSSFSASELSEIQSIWQQVSEDFAPFNVNVTTQDPGVDALRKTSSSDSRWGVRVLFTDNRNDRDGSAVAAGAGGVAYIGSFNRNVDQPVFVFNKGAKAAAVTASHEVGHSLFLGHDGISGQTSYHPGHGSGATSWGTIMGAPFQENLTQWSGGDYSGADNKEDDLSIITTKNGFGYRTDDYGNNQSTAAELILNSAGDVSAYGVIERNTDVDYFSFTTDAGNVSFSITPVSKAFVANGGGGYTAEFLDANGSNLDIWAGLYNASGKLLTASNPSNLLTASFNLALTAGTYFIRIDGVGQGNPFTQGSTGYTDYGSLGQYSIQGNIAPPTIISRIESQGNADLLETSLGYQIQRQDQIAQFVRYQGRPVTKDTFVGWSAIAAESSDTGFRLIWEHTDGRYGEWQTDGEGNFQRSDSPSAAQLIALESVYQQNLNLDGVIGSSAAILEGKGNASLLLNNQGYQIQRQDQSVQFVRYQRQPVTKDTFAGWSAIAAASSDTGFRLIWEHTNGQYGEWQTDGEGNFQGSDSPSAAQLMTLESTYQQDLNLDGAIGSSAAIIENTGNTSLLLNNQGYQIQHQDQSVQFVRYQGQPVTKDTFAGWSAIAAASSDTGFRLIWEHTNGQYGEWQTDGEGNFQGSDSPNAAQLMTLESVYQQDLNLDGVIGSSAAIIENTGNTSLLLNNQGYQIQHQDQSVQFVRYQGQPVTKDTFAGWSAIAAASSDTGFRLIWEHTNGQYGEWQTDRAGNFQGSDSPSAAQLITLESIYQQDLNLDGAIGSSAAILEDKGNASLLHNQEQGDILLGDQGNNLLVGGLGDDKILGLDGNDTLIGGLGHDTLVGGLGADQFFLASTGSSADTVTDFVEGLDILGLSASEFRDGFEGDSVLAVDQFVLGASPTNGDPQFLYDVSSGQLLYDQDGNGQRTAIHIAILSSKPTLSHLDFVITP